MTDPVHQIQLIQGQAIAAVSKFHLQSGFSPTRQSSHPVPHHDWIVAALEGCRNHGANSMIPELRYLNDEESLQGCH